MSDYLLETILELTGDAKSAAFWKKVIRVLPESVILEEIGELKYQIHKGSVENRAKYLTELFKKRMRGAGDEKNTHFKVAIKKPTSHRCENQTELFAELRKIETKKDEDPQNEKSMILPFSRLNVPWATFVQPQFFTLPTNKTKSDKILMKLRTHAGDDYLVPVHRGKNFPKDTERGILTAEHGRILAALAKMWAEGPQKYLEYENGACRCYCEVPVRKLAKMLGWKSFGGNELNHLKKKVIDLKTMPYYFELEGVEEFRAAGIKGYGFTFLHGVEIIDKDKNNKEETILDITFCDQYSRQLIKRRTVSRLPEMIRHRNNIAFLLRLEIEPFLMGNGKYEKTLKELILILHLPLSEKYKYTSRRKDLFDKAVRELNLCHLVDGRKWQVTLEKTDDDYKLVAHAVGFAKLIQERCSRTEPEKPDES